MTWINVKQQIPPLYEKVVLMVETDTTKEKVLWNSKQLLYGWLDRVIEDEDGFICRFFDLKRYNTVRGKVTHWMSLPPEPEI